MVRNRKRVEQLQAVWQGQDGVASPDDRELGNTTSIVVVARHGCDQPLASS